ncbi:hypothetical protein FIBSPDRAFT_38690 [Athelia psychrophila]|uniref:Uncharacterized protein n=1 Tax=Athelia psychrophila TaxID=1759441 RepID=A0A166FK98_9AGAM|nr:hypothetical protein FIBSPDRAFT_38690 [Fibularhizoctonia sp. CBS 109695]
MPDLRLERPMVGRWPQVAHPVVACVRINHCTACYYVQPIGSHNRIALFISLIPFYCCTSGQVLGKSSAPSCEVRLSHAWPRHSLLNRTLQNTSKMSGCNSGSRNAAWPGLTTQLKVELHPSKMLSTSHLLQAMICGLARPSGATQIEMNAPEMPRD